MISRDEFNSTARIGLVKLLEIMDVKFLGMLLLVRLTMVESLDVIKCSEGNENTVGKNLDRFSLACYDLAWCISSMLGGTVHGYIIYGGTVR